MDIRELKRFLVYYKSRFLHGLKGVKVGYRSYVGKRVKISKNSSIGKYCYIGENSTFHQKVQIGNFCLISDLVSIIGNDHYYEKVGSPIIFSGVPEPLTTIIGDDVWIGHMVSIKAGVTIGEGSIVGSNSVVTHDIPSYEVWAGVPAKKIKDRFISLDDRKSHQVALNEFNRVDFTPKTDREI